MNKNFNFSFCQCCKIEHFRLFTHLKWMIASKTLFTILISVLFLVLFLFAVVLLPEKKWKQYSSRCEKSEQVDYWEFEIVKIWGNSNCILKPSEIGSFNSFFGIDVDSESWFKKLFWTSGHLWTIFSGFRRVIERSLQSKNFWLGEKFVSYLFICLDLNTNFKTFFNMKDILRWTNTGGKALKITQVALLRGE